MACLARKLNYKGIKDFQSLKGHSISLDCCELSSIINFTIKNLLKLIRYF